MTLPTDSWASVPYSCSELLSLDYHGANLTTGSGDGYGFLEPDKVGEVGFAFLQLYEHTGQQRYLDTALACANALVTHQQPGDSVASPWPFRVDAATGQNVLDGYCAQVVGALRLFRELARLGTGARQLSLIGRQPPASADLPRDGLAGCGRSRLQRAAISA